MKIHFISNSLRQNSGFSNVTRYLALGLQKLGHEITMTGLQTAYNTDWNYGIECLPIQTYYTGELGQLMNNIMRTEPDIVFFVGQMDGYTNSLAKVFPKTLVYCPVEGYDINDLMINDLNAITKNGGKVIAQCKYGYDEMLKAGVGVSGYIYHGYNDKIFKPIPKGMSHDKYCYYATDIGREASNPKLLRERGCHECPFEGMGHVETYGVTNICPYYQEEVVTLLRWIKNEKKEGWTQYDIGIDNLKNDEAFIGKFVYGFVGQNFGYRKRIERLLTAYAMMIIDSQQMRDRTTIHLHTLPVSDQGMNLLRIVDKLGIKENVTFSYGTTRSSSWSEESLARLYNIFDVNVSASSSEGYGMATTESMVCGKANIGPACSSFVELIGDGEKDPEARGYLALIGENHMIQDGTMRALVNEHHLSTMMKSMYVKDADRERFGKNAQKWVKQFTWDKITKQFDKVLNDMR